MKHLIKEDEHQKEIEEQQKSEVLMHLNKKRKLAGRPTSMKTAQLYQQKQQKQQRRQEEEEEEEEKATSQRQKTKKNDGSTFLSTRYSIQVIPCNLHQKTIKQINRRINIKKRKYLASLISQLLGHFLKVISFFPYSPSSFIR